MGGGRVFFVKYCRIKLQRGINIKLFQKERKAKLNKHRKTGDAHKISENSKITSQ